jgi:hypothetical protein
MIIISASKKQKLNSDNSLPKNDNSRMNQVEIQNDNLGATIDQTEDMIIISARFVPVHAVINRLYFAITLIFLSFYIIF